MTLGSDDKHGYDVVVDLQFVHGKSERFEEFGKFFAIGNRNGLATAELLTSDGYFLPRFLVKHLFGANAIEHKQLLSATDNDGKALSGHVKEFLLILTALTGRQFYSTHIMH